MPQPSPVWAAIVALPETPPPAAPAQMVFGFFDGQHTEVMRPPTLVGPTSSHWAVPASGASEAATRERSPSRARAEGSR